MNNKNILQNFRKAFFREKYRFDQGNAFLVFVNFALLVAALINQNGGKPEIIKYYVIGGLFATWFLGYILDRVVQVQDIQERVILKRSPIWQQNFARHDDHEEKLATLISKLENIEKRLEKNIKKTMPTKELQTRKKYANINLNQSKMKTE
ncbi:MAG: hypothetical protein WCP93_00875 [Candidatus Berkelbacteria bacterium]